MAYSVKCLNCGNEYMDEDPDPYYCPPCKEERKKLAAQIDAKIKPQKESISGLQQFDALPKVGGFVNSKYL